MPRNIFQKGSINNRKRNASKSKSSSDESECENSSSFQSPSTPTDFNQTSSSRLKTAKSRSESQRTHLEKSRTPRNDPETSRASRYDKGTPNTQRVLPGTSRSQRDEPSKSAVVLERSPQETHRILTEIISNDRPEIQRILPRKQRQPTRVPNAIGEIKKLQESTKTIIPLAPFMRLVREIFLKFKPDARLTPSAIGCLQESAEMYIVQLLEDSYKCTLHRQRITLGPSDIQLVRILRGLRDPGNEL